MFLFSNNSFNSIIIPRNILKRINCGNVSQRASLVLSLTVSFLPDVPGVFFRLVTSCFEYSAYILMAGYTSVAAQESSTNPEAGSGLIQTGCVQSITFGWIVCLAHTEIKRAGPNQSTIIHNWFNIIYGIWYIVNWRNTVASNRQFSCVSKPFIWKRVPLLFRLRFIFMQVKLIFIWKVLRVLKQRHKNLGNGLFRAGGLFT